METYRESLREVDYQDESALLVFWFLKYVEGRPT